MNVHIFEGKFLNTGVWDERAKVYMGIFVGQSIQNNDLEYL